MVRTKLLDLPNELFLEIFRYFDVSQLFYSLFGLTVRLDNLLKQCHSRHLNLGSTENFNLVFRYIKPERIRSLAVRNSKQMNLFEELFANQQFLKNCQALTIYDTTPYDFIFLVRRLSQFENLSSLSVLRSCHITYVNVYGELMRSVINNEMPTLKYLKLVVPDQGQFLGAFQSSLMFISNHLEHLILSHSTTIELFGLFRRLPNLTDIRIYSLRL
jgi:hypothetical protein